MPPPFCLIENMTGSSVAEHIYGNALRLQCRRYYEADMQGWSLSTCTNSGDGLDMNRTIGNKLITKLDQLLIGIATFALTAIVIISLVGVVSRYGFNKPLFWGMELSSSLAVWMTFIVAGLNYKRDIHFKVDIIYGALHKKGKFINDIFVSIVTLFCVSVCLYSAVVAFMRNYKMSMAAMEISVSFSLYLPVIIGYITYIFYLVTRFFIWNKEEQEEL